VAGCHRRGDGEATGRSRAAVDAVRHHARDRLLLPCPYSTSLSLRLGLLPGPSSAPLLLGLAGGAMGARRRPPRGRDGWDWPGRPLGPDRRHERPPAGQLSAGPHPFPPTLPPGHEGTCPPKNTCPHYLLENTANIVRGQEGHENQGGISENIFILFDGGEARIISLHSFLLTTMTNGHIVKP